MDIEKIEILCNGVDDKCQIKFVLPRELTAQDVIALNKCVQQYIDEDNSIQDPSPARIMFAEGNKWIISPKFYIDEKDKQEQFALVVKGFLKSL